MATTTVSTTATVTAPTVTLKSRGSQQQQQQQPQFPDVNTIRKAIPAHCFKPSAVRSLAYVARDLAMSGALVWAAVTYIHQLPNVYARTAAWMAYGYAQGLVCTGIWILAHECGHGAFSMHRRLNDFVGWALHSYLMVPFFSWKFSHARHHKYTGHMEKDMAFVPATKEEHEHKLKTQWWHSDLVEDAPAFVLLKLIGHQLFAWPAYLLFNLSSGPNSLQGEKICTTTTPTCRTTAPSRGSLSRAPSPPSTVTLAGSTSTFSQVVHHLFSKIPFYYAGEATEAIKPMLGDLYHEEKGSFYGHLWSSFKDLKYVESDPAAPGTMRWAGVKRA